MKLHRKIKYNEKVCHIQNLGSYVQGPVHSRVRDQIHISVITQTTKANLRKRHRKIQHKEVCHAQELGSYTPG